MMTKIVRAAAGILFPFVLIFGFYIVAHGHLTPGGGFQGGAVIATGIVLLIAAFGAGEIKRRIGTGALKGSEALGLLLFIGTAAAAFGFGGTFFANWLTNGGAIFGNIVPFGPNPGDLNTGGVIPLMNLAVGIEVLGALSVIVMLMLKGVGEEAE
jgi:multicomponent Na+:H+ antiporter subunit B